MATELVHSDKLGMAICDALDMDWQRISRVIIDCQAGSVAMVYLETYASGKTLDLDWSKGLKGAEITILEK